MKTITTILIAIILISCQQSNPEPQAVEYGFTIPAPSVGVDWQDVDKVKKEITQQISALRAACIEFDRDCSRLSWSPKPTTTDTTAHATFYVIHHRLKNGQCAGLWHNQKGGWATEFYDYSDNWFLTTSYNTQVSETVIQKVRGQETVFPAEVRFQDGLLTVKHKTSSYENDLEEVSPEPAVWGVDFNSPIPDTSYIRYDCDRVIFVGTGSWE